MSAIAVAFGLILDPVPTSVTRIVHRLADPRTDQRRPRPRQIAQSAHGAMVEDDAIRDAETARRRRKDGVSVADLARS